MTGQIYICVSGGLVRDVLTDDRRLLKTPITIVDHDWSLIRVCILSVTITNPRSTVMSGARNRAFAPSTLSRMATSNPELAASVKSVPPSHARDERRHADTKAMRYHSIPLAVSAALTGPRD